MEGRSQVAAGVIVLYVKGAPRVALVRVRLLVVQALATAVLMLALVICTVEGAEICRLPAVPEDELMLCVEIVLVWVLCVATVVGLRIRPPVFCMKVEATTKLDAFEKVMARVTVRSVAAKLVIVFDRARTVEAATKEAVRY